MKEIVNQSLVEQIHRILQEEITSVRLAPGEKLAVDKLAKRFGVSRTPVREALNLLVEEGLARVVPRVGYFVVAITAKDVEDISDVRKMCELYAMDRAIRRLTDAEIDSLEQRLLSTMALPDPRERETVFRDVDSEFHSELIARSGNRRLQQIADRIYVFVRLMRHLNDRTDAAMEEHLAIIRAMRRRDAEEAKRLLAEHIDNVQAAILEGLGARLSLGGGSAGRDRPNLDDVSPISHDGSRALIDLASRSDV